MIVRESPKRKGQSAGPDWPPKSPHQALLSSPSGRRKYEQRLAERDRAVSPSPVRRRPMSRAQSDLIADDDDEDDDEETLQLKLAQIDARLKLKKLQKAREAAQSRPQAAVEVPRSPVRTRRVEEDDAPKIPARVLLGIDKGLKADQVSLKPPPVSRPRVNTPHPGPKSSRPSEPPKGKSFNQRIAESRNTERAREDKESRIAKNRSAGFGLQRVASADKGASSAGSPITRNPPTPLPKSATALKYAEIGQRDNSDGAASFESISGLHLKTRNMAHKDLTRVLEGKTTLTIPQLLKTVKGPEYDPPDMENDYVVLGVICSKTQPMTAKNARQNQANGGQSTDANQTGKFMVIKLTDLKNEMDLFLFDTGFSRFWKLPLGTLVAVLNPDIMRPRTRDDGRFSLKLTSSDDTVLEIGTARDLDFCHAKKKDGVDCAAWIDSRKTEYCEYHITVQVEKSRRGRMEIATMTGSGFGRPTGGKMGMFGRRGGRFDVKKFEEEGYGKTHDGFLHETMFIAPPPGGAARLLDSDEAGFERGASRAERHRKQLAEKEQERELAQKLYSIGQGAGAEYMRAKGAKAASLTLNTRVDTQAASSQESLPTDAMGLLNRKADDVSLAPIKRKRAGSEKSTASSEPVGWGGAFKRGLLLSPAKSKPPTSAPAPSSPQRAGAVSPTKKKARLLVPDKGIREPGRDSLPTMDVGLLAATDDDDDDLEFI
ncbi:hypothetical protein M011DRAFT_406527 [Sporormia fimetaria CBS 119925]|uniref:Uncharacterized protein n=1 Tax=Sporormia fimetaria CBS 119925 TaxID=1340428 RepID=A0A6A6V8K8_9PLEO|nr:hypothetical protein M011DRAFT_406527 [Sporormia fimetaria CBS 119925]